MATISDIAKVAGVSPKTVSNVLSGRLRANRRDAVTRAQRIRQVALEMNYRPNTAARAMSTGRFDALALIHGSNVGHRFMPERLWTGIHEAAEEHGQKILSSVVNDARLTDADAMPHLLSEFSVDGLLIDYLHDAPDRMIDLLDTHQLPAIWINHKREQDCVYPDDDWAGSTSTRALLELGHQRIAFVNRRSDSHFSVTDRRSGYERAMREAGLTPVELDLPSEEPLMIADACLDLLRSPDRPSAVFCYGSSEAMGLIHAAARLGLDVPRDLSVVAVSHNFAHELGFHISLARHYFSEVGRVAIARLLDKIAAPSVAIDPISIQGTWHEGQTLAPPRSTP
ncbi:MAG: LacI family DNA-binding transcriptional regulator [Planctomycetota bacterium]